MMRLSVWVENTSTRGLPVEHGLSLYLQTETHGTLLFDLGQGTLFAENAVRLGFEGCKVDRCFVSHGHYDHGGGLATFLALRPQTPVYVHRRAFEPHYSRRKDGWHEIGLDSSLRTHRQLIFTDDICLVEPGLLLFAGVKGERLLPPGNRLLFSPVRVEPATFPDEQSLWVEEGGVRVLVAGCAHRGILNILDRAHELTGQWPTHVVAGMHLVKMGLSAEAEAEFIAQLAEGLRAVPGCRYYTLHCTGEGAYAELRKHLGSRIAYLACGDEVSLTPAEP